MNHLPTSFLMRLWQHKLRCSVFIIILLVSFHVDTTYAVITDSTSYVSTNACEECFVLSDNGSAAPLLVSSNDYWGVIRALNDLQSDIKRVTNVEPDLSEDKIPPSRNLVIVGTLGKSPVIERLVKEGKIDLSGIRGKWETFQIQAIKNPLPGIDKALVIAGSDKRGTIYGIYDLSEHIGVSPWYWWADVPVRHEAGLYIKPGRYTSGPPAVKYRGIFLNDEAPALSGWAHGKFGGFNHHFYDKVFELMLRLKANYLWPAMWGNAFDVDDTLNPVMANKYGIVMGTSHQEPMMRNTQEWRSKENPGPWDYQTNADTLRAYWRKGIKRMDGRESIVTLGMRGNGDKPMSEQSNIALLEKIVQDQRHIIADVTGKPASDTPQLWALYKEVQDYYDKGMKVPDDVTLLFSDDNWGNVRRLPGLKDSSRPGGFGMYYHFDYVGGPRNYKWLNTNQISKVWEQMHLAYEYGVKRIWIVNVGDLKPMEFPITFFLDYAWNPDKWPAKRLPEYTHLWTKEQFGSKYADKIADILNKYTTYNSRRKPELLSPDTYSLSHYREAERVVDDYNKLAREARKLYKQLPSQYKAAYYQLVLYPVEACANLNDMYVSAAKNHLYARQGRAATNDLADSVRVMFKRDSLYSHYYNKVMADGKWNHMMDQTHIGYTYWQQPKHNNMPKVETIDLAEKADMGIAVEGSDNWWPNEEDEAALPTFDPYLKRHYYIDVFNRGKEAFKFTVRSGASWLQISSTEGTVDTQKRLWVSINWMKAPKGTQRVPLTITGPNGDNVIVYTVIHNPRSPQPDEINGFVEGNGYVSMEAAHYTRVIDTSPVTWHVIPNLGRTLSGITPFPVTADNQKPGGDSPRLEYRMYLFDSGDVTVNAYVDPTQNFHNTRGLRYAISFDDQPPKIVNINADDSPRAWATAVSNNIKLMKTRLHLDEPGVHVLKFWMIDPGIVLQKLVVDTGGMKSSYLGPPESYHRNVNENEDSN